MMGGLGNRFSFRRFSLVRKLRRLSFRNAPGAELARRLLDRFADRGVRLLTDPIKIIYP